MAKTPAPECCGNIEKHSAVTPMAEPQPGSPEVTPEHRLESWKEIAVYLNRGVRTVRRWEKDEGLPVHRHAHKKLSSVYAHRSELDSWREGRSRAQPTGGAVPKRSERSVSKRVMIAVLPFASVVEAGETDYIADGLTEEMIGQLGRFSPEELGVIARTTVMLYRRRDRSVREIAAELKVDYVVDGSVRREGDRLRVMAHLIDAVDQAQLWSNTYEQAIGSVLVLQRDLARDIAAGVRLTIGPRHDAQSTAAGPVKVDAYYAHLQGRHLLNSFTPESVRGSIDAFQRAIAADPTYAPAYASLAESYQQLPVWTEASPASTFPLALEAAEHAVRLDPNLPDAYASLGLINASYVWDWNEADRHFRRALALNPSCSPARQWYAEFLAEMGRFDEALSIIDAALVYDPLSRGIQATRAFVLWVARRFDDAIDQAEAVLDMDPAYPMALIRLGVAYAGKGEYAQAVRAFRRAAVTAPELPACLGLLGYAHARAGDGEQALAALDKLRRLSEDRYVPAFPFAIVHLGLGDWDNTLRFMEREYDNRGWYLLLLNKGPFFDPLRGDARFDALVRRLEFPGA